MFPGPSELILILVIALLVFGPKKIPEIMGGLGQGIKSFKRAMDGEDDTLPPVPMPEHNPPGLPPPVPVHPEAAPAEKSRTE